MHRDSTNSAAQNRSVPATSLYPDTHNPAPSIAASLSTIAIILGGIFLLSQPVVTSLFAVTVVAGVLIARRARRAEAPTLPIPGTHIALQWSVDAPEAEVDADVRRAIRIALVNRS